MYKDDSQCVFCKRRVPTRGHHIVPKCKGGKDIKNTCYSCEDFIHNTWTHNQLRDVYNTVESILKTDEYKKFNKWLMKQPTSIVFKSNRSTNRADRKYR